MWFVVLKGYPFDTFWCLMQGPENAISSVKFRLKLNKQRTRVYAFDSHVGLYYTRTINPHLSFVPCTGRYTACTCEQTMDLI